jgi:hypothetical protein
MENGPNDKLAALHYSVSRLLCAALAQRVKHKTEMKHRSNPREGFYMVKEQ